MDPILAIMIGLLVTAFAVGFYMDWFDLWASKDDMKAQLARSKEAARHDNVAFANALAEISERNEKL